MLGFSTFSFCLLILKFELLTCGARRMPFQPSTFSLSEDVFITQFVTLRNWQSCSLSAEASQVCVWVKMGRAPNCFYFFLQIPHIAAFATVYVCRWTVTLFSVPAATELFCFQKRSRRSETEIENNFRTKPGLMCSDIQVPPSSFYFRFLYQSDTAGSTQTSVFVLSNARNWNLDSPYNGNQFLPCSFKN